MLKSPQLKITVLLLCLLLLLSCKKNPFKEKLGTIRYKEKVFKKVEVKTDVTYGAAKTQGGTNKSLKMDIYTGEGDNEGNRPLIILAHGGGFTDGDKEEFEELSAFLAKSGYVVASINYRLLDIELTETTIKRAVIEAVTDMKAAARYFVKDAGGSNTYRITQSHFQVF